MTRTTLRWSPVWLLSICAMLAFTFTYAFADVDPPSVDMEADPGDEIEVEKTVLTPAIPPLVDVCLLQDETGSYFSFNENLKGATAETIFDEVTAISPDAQFGVAGFRDYPVSPHGASGDWVYRLIQPLTGDRDDWVDGVDELTAGGGADIPEAQYDAIVAAAGPGVFTDPTLGAQDDCGWRDEATRRVLMVATDAPFHVGTGVHVNDHDSTVAALQAQGITLVGLKAPGAGMELDDLAAATGGTIIPVGVTADGPTIAAAIIEGLANLPVEVTPVAVCDPGLSVSFDPDSQIVISGDTAIFTETISVALDAAQGESLECVVTFLLDGEEVDGFTQTISIEVQDVEPPVVQCIETVNPSGRNIPAAGINNPGNSGQNPDGFYELLAEDNVDPDPQIFVVDSADTGVEFGPFPSGTKIKLIQAPGAPQQVSEGPGAIDYQIRLKGDALVYAVDASGNVSERIECLVPPPPR